MDANAHVTLGGSPVRPPLIPSKCTGLPHKKRLSSGSYQTRIYANPRRIYAVPSNAVNHSISPQFSVTNGVFFTARLPL